MFCASERTMDLCLQMSKTRVINRKLNPVWDEELMLSVPNPPPSLKLVAVQYFGIGRFGELGTTQFAWTLAKCVVMSSNVRSYVWAPKVFKRLTDR